LRCGGHGKVGTLVALQTLWSQFTIMLWKVTICLFNTCLTCSPTESLEDRWVQWNFSNQTCRIINVDESCLGNPIRAGLRGSFRHLSGSWSTNFPSYIAGTFDILLAKLHVIHWGLILAKDLNLQIAIFYTENCVHILKEPTPRLRFYIHVTLQYLLHTIL